MPNLNPAIVQAFEQQATDIQKAVAAAPDWSVAAAAFDAVFQKMKNPAGKVWPADRLPELKQVYFKARDEDKECANITVRTVRAMPPERRNDTKIIFLEIANVCRIFNASHKVNFEAEELPGGFTGVPMAAGKAKGMFTYAQPMPAIYQKISLTFDYWIPKFLEWTEEIRSKNLTDWRGGTVLQHESCTDFMRLCLLFLSEGENYPPIAKAEDREAILKNWFGEEFTWLKKSAKREDIPGNSEKLRLGFGQLSREAGVPFSHAALPGILQLAGVKPLVKV